MLGQTLCGHHRPRTARRAAARHQELQGRAGSARGAATGPHAISAARRIAGRNVGRNQSGRSAMDNPICPHEAHQGMQRKRPAPPCPAASSSRSSAESCLKGFFLGETRACVRLRSAPFFTGRAQAFLQRGGLVSLGERQRSRSSVTTPCAAGMDCVL